ncbi:MAG: fumarate reductase (CoM/CoB) subunit, partial [Candidatus Poribacteria bacterium]|nr:fumarate reductase (CoM/CoB) subunit [Candidatus Poribacteria bacterium]
VIETEARVPFEHLMKYGIDLRKDKVEFAPAIQHFNGGVRINVNAESSLKGLYSAGENAGGQHGADRPGGNALADCQVHGKIAGENASKFSLSKERKQISNDKLAEIEKAYVDLITERKGEISLDKAIADLQWVMWKNASVVRTADGLNYAISYISSAPSPTVNQNEFDRYIDYRNMLIVGKMVAENALMRNESRGTHYRADCDVVNDPLWLKQIIITNKNNDMKHTTYPINLPQDLEYLKSKLEGA